MKPIVSCIMPTTRKRARWIPQAVKYFERQDIDATLELVVMSEESVADIVRECSTGDRRITLHTCMSGITIGRKRALAHEAAQGEYLMPWDDDDWHSADRVSYQLEQLKHGMAGSAFKRCGSPLMMFWDLADDRLFLLDMTTVRRHRQRYVPTGAMLYTAGLAAQFPCPDIGQGYDGPWQSALPPAMPLDRWDYYLAIRHGGNGSPLDIDAPGWSVLDDMTPEAIIGEDDAAWYRAMVAPMTTVHPAPPPHAEMVEVVAAARDPWHPARPERG